MTLDEISQLVITIGSIGVATLVSGKTNTIRRCGFTIAMLIQPAWIYTTYVHEQWGMLAVTFYYTYRNWCGWKNSAI